MLDGPLNTLGVFGQAGLAITEWFQCDSELCLAKVKWYNKDAFLKCSTDRYSIMNETLIHKVATCKIHLNCTLTGCFLATIWRGQKAGKSKGSRQEQHCYCIGQLFSKRSPKESIYMGQTFTKSTSSSRKMVPGFPLWRKHKSGAIYDIYEFGEKVILSTFYFLWSTKR